MVQVQVYNIAGEVVSSIELSDYLFGVPMNQALVHQALVRQLANRRVGAASTKTRAEVAASGRKIRRQKGTGRARQGVLRSPLLRGGGVAFGPHPRSYRQAMPKKMRRLALRCVLSTKAAQNQLKVLADLIPEEPKTKSMVRILAALGVSSSALIATSESDINLVRSTHNLSRIKPLPAALLNIVDILSHQSLIMTVDAVRKAEGIWGPRLAKQRIGVLK